MYEDYTGVDMYLRIPDILQRTSMIRIEKLTIPSLVGLYLSSVRLSSACARVMNEPTWRASLVPGLLESWIKIKKLPNEENDTKEETNQGWYSSTTVCL